MWISTLSLDEFRNIASESVSFESEGLIYIVGENAQGKTNLLEAIFLLLRNRSFRQVDRKALIRSGSTMSHVRGTMQVDAREISVSIEIHDDGRDRYLFNNKTIRRAEELIHTFPVVVFQPDDLDVIKGSPSLRREYLDEILASMSPKYADALSRGERVLRQRNVLLKQAEGRLSAEIAMSLDVWDEKFAEVANLIAQERMKLVQRLAPLVDATYGAIARVTKRVSMSYLSSWEGDIRPFLVKSRNDDVRRTFTTVGPHRDDLVISLDGLSSRTSSSQGEQRTLAYALRSSMARILGADVGTSPIVILDDVISELDAHRTHQLLIDLPGGQTIVSGTTVPSGLIPRQVIEVSHGRVL